MTVNKVTTTVEHELWREATLAGYGSDKKWREALELGLRAMLGKNLAEKELIDKRAKLLAELQVVEKALKDLQVTNSSRKDELEVLRTHKDELRLSYAILKKDRSFIKGRMKRWLNMTGMHVSEGEFLKLCERAEAGEFDKGAKK